MISLVPALLLLLLLLSARFLSPFHLLSVQDHIMRQLLKSFDFRSGGGLEIVFRVNFKVVRAFSGDSF